MTNGHWEKQRKLDAQALGITVEELMTEREEIKKKLKLRQL